MKLRTNLVATYARTICAAALLCAASLAVAQPRSSYALGTSTGRGDGWLQWEGSKEMQVERVELHLKGDFTFDLHVVGRNRHRIYGSWSQGGSNSVRLSVHNAFNDRNAQGSGTVSYGSQLNTITRLDLSGWANRSSFSLSFAPYRSGGVGGPGFGPPGFGGPSFGALPQRGSGTVSFNRSGTTQVHEATVSLLPTGHFTVNLSGRFPYTFSGTWTERNSNTVDLRITNAAGDRRASGSGTVIFAADRRGFSRIFMSGYANGDRFMAQFDASSSYGGGSPYFELRASHSGSGEVKYGNAKTAIRWMDVNLRPGGQFTSQWYDGRGYHSFEGTYTYRQGSTRVDLRLTSAYGRRASGTGRMDLSRDLRSVSYMEVKSRFEGRDLEAKFRTR